MQKQHNIILTLQSVFLQFKHKNSHEEVLVFHMKFIA